MTRRRRAAQQHDLVTLFNDARRELAVPEDFPADVEQAARATADELAQQAADGDDLTGVAFATLDPVGSMDLDQAFHLERAGSGIRVRYAIADVARAVPPGGPVDVEAHVRGVTLYSPDTRTPLHPPVLSEGAASLLPDQVRAAVVWTIDLDDEGEQVAVDVRRATVRSTRRLDYESVQQQVDAGTDDELLVLLREVGEKRLAVERRRGGMSLTAPEQEVVPDDDTWTLRYRTPLASETWNAQLSLLTGMAAARIMLDGGVGILRTMPDADQRDVDRLRRVAAALHVDWPRSQSYGALLEQLDGSTPAQAAFLDEASVLFRGAAYTLVSESGRGQIRHAAVAAPYAHVTAPLRRLADRYATEACLALTAGDGVPEWVRSGLPDLPRLMEEATRRQNALERACLDVVEAVVLASSVGSTFEGVVVDVREKGGGTVMLAEPAVMARCDGDLSLGERIRVRVVEADPSTRGVRLSPA